MGLSKQSVHQMMQRHKYTLVRGEEFIKKGHCLRDKHPVLGCRKMAMKLKVPGFGRDKMEELFLNSGFRISYPPNYTKTTQSVGGNKFKNLIEGLLVKGINEVVQSDITYFWMNGRFGYLVFIIDVYSRLIVGYHASFGLQTEGNMKALAMMIKLRGKANLKGMIHHSDRGSQYDSIKYRKMLTDHGIQISMCKEAWENAYAERINRTMKHEYLRHREIDTLKLLRKHLAKDVKAYNTDRPHWSVIKQMAPETFETYVKQLPKSKRPEMTIYKHDENTIDEFFSAMQQSINKIAVKG